MPGINPFEQERRGRCPECGGWDMGGAGFIHHAASCSHDGTHDRGCRWCRAGWHPPMWFSKPKTGGAKR